MGARAPILCLVLALGLASCAGPTAYAPSSQQAGGYSQTRIEPGRYRVTFAGNSLTPRETVESYALYRAAEVTLEQGGDHFVVTRRSTDIDTRYIADYPPTPYFAPYYPYLAYPNAPVGPFPYTYAPRRIDAVRRYASTLEFVVREGPKQPDDPEAYDAQAVIDNLGPVVRRPGDPRS